MYKGNETSPVAVWIFTYSANGRLNVTQTVVDKEKFGDTYNGMAAIGRWIRKNLKDADKCPYSPNNTSVEIEDDTSLMVQTDKDGSLEEISDGNDTANQSAPHNAGDADEPARAKQVRE